ncbi:MAG TPA: cbb3-type cytochrome oxidase assembly protein CcoS [Pantanalinema sp.]
MFIILPITFLAAAYLLYALIKGIRAGEYDDVEGEKYRILHDEE